LAKIEFLYSQNGQASFDLDHPKNSKIFMVKMVNLNLIMAISTIPDYLSLKFLEFVEIVEIFVNFDHLTMTIWEIRSFYGHVHGRTPPPQHLVREKYRYKIIKV
jgi:hypothetical protein